MLRVPRKGLFFVISHPGNEVECRMVFVANRTRALIGYFNFKGGLCRDAPGHLSS